MARKVRQRIQKRMRTKGRINKTPIFRRDLAQRKISVRTFNRTSKKPNPALRKVVKSKLSGGKKAQIYTYVFCDDEVPF